MPDLLNVHCTYIIFAKMTKVTKKTMMTIKMTKMTTMQLPKPADSAVVYDDVPGPQRHRVPFLHFKPLLVLVTAANI